MNAEATPEKAALPPRAFPVIAAAEQLNCSQSHVWNLIRRGAIRPMRLGRRTLIPASELSRLLGEAPDAASPQTSNAA